MIPCLNNIASPPLQPHRKTCSNGLKSLYGGMGNAQVISKKQNLICHPMGHRRLRCADCGCARICVPAPEAASKAGAIGSLYTQHPAFTPLPTGVCCCCPWPARQAERLLKSPEPRSTAPVSRREGPAPTARNRWRPERSLWGDRKRRRRAVLLH